MPKISLPTPLRPYAGNKAEIALPGGTTIGQVLQTLASTYPDLRKHIFDDKGVLRHFVNVYINDDDVRHLQKMETPVRETDQISIVPSIAGGSAELSKDEVARYSRHLIMPEVGIDGQKKLKQGAVLLVGTGGLGSPAAMYLAAAGVGHIGLVDYDVVDASNLQRQIIHGQSSLGVRKVDSAKKRLLDINPHIQVTTFNERLSSDNAMKIFQSFDVVADGTDNFPTRYLVNDACVLLGKPNVYASIFRFEGQASVFDAKRGPCYRCLYTEPPPPGLVPSCAEGGVLGILPGVMGVLQATEVVKLILGIGESLLGRLMLFDALTMKFRELKLRKDPACVLCGAHPTVTKLIDYEQFCGMPSHDHEKMAAQPEMLEISATELAARLPKNNLKLVDVREPHEWDICHIDGAKLIPLGQLQARLGELNQNDDIILYCKMGSRSMRALHVLKDAGFTKLKSLKGGIISWGKEVDDNIALY